MSGEAFVELGTVDPSRIVVKKAETSSFKKGKDTIETTKSKVFYLDDDGNECELYFNLASQVVPFGFSINYKYGTDKSKMTPEELKDVQDNMQVGYQMTSMSTKDNPTEPEQQCFDVLDTFRDCVIKALKAECGREERLVPDPTWNSYCAAERDENWDYAVKPIYGYPTKAVEGRKKRVEDRTKPQRAYFKLLTSGKGRKMKCNTEIYGPGDKPVSATSFVGKRGILDFPVFHFDSIYWGAHGKASYGASAQIKLVQCNWKPQSKSGPRKRYTPQNTMSATDPGAEVSSESSEEGTGFPDPTGGQKESTGFSRKGDDDENPMKKMYEDGSEETEEATEEDEDEEQRRKEEERKKKMAEKRKRAAARKRRARATKKKESSEEQ